VKNLSLCGVSVQFGAVRALEGMDLVLEEGETRMLVGPNGAGKSTLLKVLLGLVRAQSGVFRVEGKPCTHDNAFKERLGYLPENVAFSENLTGYQVLSFFARARGVGQARIGAVLEQVSLSHAARRAVRGYSRGMRQRLGLAVAVLAEPPLLILDEPTGGLDQEGLSVLWSILKAWREAGRMVLLSTHDIALLERRVDRVQILKQGRELALGRPDALREQAALPLKIHLHFADEVAAKRAMELAWLAEREPSLGYEPKLLGVTLAPSLLLDFLRGLDALGAELTQIRIEEPALDEVYEALLGREKDETRR
jgi:Cu-processing system ATP-binding protein